MAAAVAVAALWLGGAAPAQAGFPEKRLAQSQAEVRSYWTAERMRAALPATRLLGGAAAPDALPPTRESVAPTRVPPVRRSLAGPLDGLLGGGSAEPAERRATAIPNTRRWPYRTHGKVYLTLPDGIIGTPDDYVCSGTVVRAPNRRLVTSAGHCVHGFGRFARNWLFVPAKDGGREPYGRWVAGRLATTRQWQANEDVRYDVGMATMRKRNGRRLQRVVGARGIAFGVNPRRYRAYGYPAESPYDGTHLYRCASRLEGTDQRMDPPRPRRISCDMTAGSSGGGWVVRERYVNSVISYGYECTIPVFPCENPDRGKLFGPYFGKTIKKLYRSQRGGR